MPSEYHTAHCCWQTGIYEALEDDDDVYGTLKLFIKES